MVREPITEDLEVAVLGGGFAGLLASARLVRAGVKGLRVIEMGGDFGGVWYWNRYPGISCDNDSYCYMPLLEEVGDVFQRTPSPVDQRPNPATDPDWVKSLQPG